MYLKFTETKKMRIRIPSKHRNTDRTNRARDERNSEIITSSDPEAAPTGSWRLPNEGSTTGFSVQPPNPNPCLLRQKGVAAVAASRTPEP